MNKLTDTKSLYYYEEAVKYDPYSVQFLGAYIQFEYLTRNTNEALMVKQKLEKIAPNSNALKQINELTKGSK